MACWPIRALVTIALWRAVIGGMLAYQSTDHNDLMGAVIGGMLAYQSTGHNDLTGAVIGGMSSGRPALEVRTHLTPHPQLNCRQIQPPFSPHLRTYFVRIPASVWFLD